MKTYELIKELENMPQDAEVTYYSEEAGGFCYVESVQLENNRVELQGSED